MNKEQCILIAGVGNIFLGDDAFGVRVIERLQARGTGRPEIVAHDYGIRGLDLAYALAEEWRGVVLVDAMPRGEAPGTLYKIQPQLPGDAAGFVQGHNFDLRNALAFACASGAKLDRLFLIGCEPSPMDEWEDMRMELSAPVMNAIDPAVDMALQIALEMLPPYPAKETEYAKQHFQAHA